MSSHTLKALRLLSMPGSNLNHGSKRGHRCSVRSYFCFASSRFLYLNCAGQAFVNSCPDLRIDIVGDHYSTTVCKGGGFSGMIPNLIIKWASWDTIGTIWICFRCNKTAVILLNYVFFVLMKRQNRSRKSCGVWIPQSQPQCRNYGQLRDVEIYNILSHFQDSNTFIHQNYMISTWIDTLAMVLNSCRISSTSLCFNRWYGDPY